MATGETEEKKHSAEFLSKATIIYKCTGFLPFSHARNKGFPLTDLHQTLDSGSTIIQPLLAKFDAIRSNRTEDMSH